MANKVYCGDKPVLPEGYVGFGSRFNCLRKGVGVGLSISRSKQLNASRVDNTPQVNRDRFRVTPQVNRALFRDTPKITRQITVPRPVIGETSGEDTKHFADPNYDNGLFPRVNVQNIYRMEHDIPHPDLPLETGSTGEVVKTELTPELPKVTTVESFTEQREGEPSVISDADLHHKINTILVNSNHIVKRKKYDKILRIFFGFLLSITLVYTIFHILRKLGVPFSISLIVIIVIGIMFIVLFVYLDN